MKGGDISLLTRPYPLLLLTTLLLPLACKTQQEALEVPADKTSGQPTTHKIVVQTNILWQGTGIQVDSGHKVILTASGEYIFHSAGYGCGPEGIPDAKPFTGNWPANELTGLALIGRIGETGIPFLVGPGTEIQPDQGGELFLGINDDIVDENTGTLSVRVEVHPPTGQNSKH